MNKIQRLSPVVAERIAAGEVIERPASVVKELVENSLDAGATEIVVTLEDGGKELIEVLDNGEGMGPEDLEVCIERHATSKLSSLDDLEKISTLGFRGEALPSIAAVSDFNLLSRAKGADTAYILNVGDLLGRIHNDRNPPRAEKCTFGEFVNARHGTRIQVRGLFSQVPARLKFLKSQNAEVSQVREWMERLALAFPQVGFKLLSGERVVLNLRPQDQKERIQSILGDGEDFPVLMASNEKDALRDVVHEGLKVRLYWLQGLSTPQSRKLIQIVNSRAIRDRLLQQAVMGPFRQALLPGQFPAIVLYVDILPSMIDVNVHPNKTEIRFLNSQKIFTTIDRLVKSLVAREGAPAIAPTAAPTAATTAMTQASDGLEVPGKLPFHTPIDLGSRLSASESNWVYVPGNNTQGVSQDAPKNVEETQQEFSQPFKFSLTSESSESLSLQPHMAQPPVVPVTQATQQPLIPAFAQALTQPLGVLFNTYILYEGNGEVVLVDQHAAHERVRYEALKKRYTTGAQSAEFASQALLMPETVKIPGEFQGPECKNHVGAQILELARFGFEIEIFGEDTLLVRAVPAEWGMNQLKIRLKNLIDRLFNSQVNSRVTSTTTQTAQSASLLIDEQLFEALASEACHSAIRAGDRLETCEAESLVQQLFQCEHPWNCPHGRPTIAKIPRGKFEEWFQRRL